MRKSLAVLLSAITLTFGAPIVAVAQAPTSTLRGQVVDTGGRGAIGMLVELVSDRLVVATTISMTDGHFSFPGLPAGNYVVRTNVNGQPTGVRVLVTSGQAASALIVLPSVATASPGVIAILAGPLLGTVVATVSVVAGNIVVQNAAGDDAAKVFESQAAAQVYLDTLNAQFPQPPPAPGQPPAPPLFGFIPTRPAS